ncbi:hypothetical protein Syun_028509 [Stephania yunnanensis]|uniref:Uncharacterized protein n=1 Tax=Stephania yunnanensis TaxID=152371 RepID=A0AAP0HLZ4_9MAGN
MREMVGDEIVVRSSEVRKWVLMGLLRDARIGEARLIDLAFHRCGSVDDGDGFRRLAELLGRIIVCSLLRKEGNEEIQAIQSSESELVDGDSEVSLERSGSSGDVVVVEGVIGE